jgi:hypothetical protein
MWPQDIVELKEGKNVDWEAGEDFTVRHINPHHPNTIQLENDDGATTFVAYYDLELKEAVGPRDGQSPKDTPQNNRYLTWP